MSQQTSIYNGKVIGVAEAHTSSGVNYVKLKLMTKVKKKVSNSMELVEQTMEFSLWYELAKFAIKCAVPGMTAIVYYELSCQERNGFANLKATVKDLDLFDVPKSVIEWKHRQTEARPRQVVATSSNVADRAHNGIAETPAMAAMDDADEVPF